MLLIGKMYITKNLDHNNGLDDDLINACVPLASEGGHYNDFKCVKIQLLENIASCCTLNDAKSTSREITNNKMLVIVIMLMTKNQDNNDGLEDDQIKLVNKTENIIMIEISIVVAILTMIVIVIVIVIDVVIVIMIVIES